MQVKTFAGNGTRSYITLLYISTVECSFCIRSVPASVSGFMKNSCGRHESSAGVRPLRNGVNGMHFNMHTAGGMSFFLNRLSQSRVRLNNSLHLRGRHGAKRYILDNP